MNVYIVPYFIQVSAVKFDTDGLTMGVGTSSAHCLTFDLRSSTPSMVKEHQYGLPVTSVTFHQVQSLVLHTFWGGIYLCTYQSVGMFQGADEF